MTTERPSVAVIGSGYWGKNLVRNYHQLGALKLICDKNETVLAQFNEQYPDVDTCLALHDVLSRDDIHGVVIATPAETHFDLAREAILAGKHLYVEKPLVLNEDQAEALIQLAGERGLSLMVGHLLQYHPAFVHLKELAALGELGRINYIYSHRLNLGKIRREENILWSFAPHDISMILALAGEYPESVLATGGNYLHRKIADVTTTHLEFPSGLRAHIFVSWLHPFKVQQLVVVGDRKMAVFDDTKPWPDKLLLYPHEIRWENNVPVPARAEPEHVGIPQSEPLRIECEHFLHCMTNGCQPITDGREGLQVLKILNAGQRSLDQYGAKICLQTSNGHAGAGVETSTPQAQSTSGSSFFAHPTAVIDDGCEIGAGTKIWHFSHVLTNSRIGQSCNIGQNVVIGPDVTIGSRCKIQNNVSVYRGVTLEDGVFCGPSMVFTNIYNPRAEIGKMDQVRPTLIRKGATLGANCTIVCGVTIGRYAFIGAGAVVTRNVPDYALVVGNPARQIGWACECGERVTQSLDCLACGKEFEQKEQGLVEKPKDPSKK
jgi:UDP-2-acetamido-3-amino-2,3-dideoxy-glucuronate N-acetyltransferase